jgi:CO/xanthine dehydrogenase FAD-binding subunit
VAARVALDGAGRCREVAIALGAVAPRPFRAGEAEASLRGEAPTRERLAAAARLAAQAARPISDVRGSDEYRQAMVRALVERELQACAPSS